MKRKLLLAALCVVSALGFKANAATDVTSTYLTDAALTDESSNWALTSSGGNHNWNADYKYRESWHNTFSLSQTVSVPNGYYQVSIQAVNSAVPSTNAKLTAVSGSNEASAYIRLSSAGSFADIAKQFSLNSDACRIYATVKVENGSLTVGFSQPNGGEWIVYGQFKLYSLTEAEYRRATVLQTALESNTNSWSASWTNGGNQYIYGRERFNETEYETGKIIYKTFGDLPLGNYEVTVHAKANVAWRTAASGNNIAQVYVGTATQDIPVEDKVGYDLTTDYCYTFEDVFVEDGNMEVGIQNIANGGNWYNVALVKLLYKGGSVAADAVALPANGAMAADTWYYFDIAVAGDEYNATATDLSKIICTVNGAQLSTSATGEVVLEETENSLSATRYYVKSSTANNLVVEAASYSYDVGSPTLSTTDGGYTQSSTFTVTFLSASTNDPDAEVELVASSTATVNGNTVDLVATTNGFTINLGSLTAGSDYAISIPANVYGYNGESMNSAISLTIHTPAVFDGVYYLYDATNKLFLGRGANYGTRAVADKYGVAMNVTTNTSGITNFTFLDGGGNKLFDANDGNIYTDNTTTPNFAVEATEGGYYVVNKNTTGSSTYNYKLYINGDKNVVAANDNSTVWTFKTSSQRDAIVNAYPTDNINTVISAAGISTTAAEFESYLATNYGATDKTSLISTATFDGNVGSWAWAEVKHQDNQPAYGTNYAELWNATGTYSQIVAQAGLPAGIYKLTVDGFERRATVDISNSLGAAGYNLVSSYLAANEEQVRLTDWYTTSKPGNTSGAVTAFNNGEATNELYIYLDGNTDLTIKLAKPNYVWDCWTIFNNFTLTYYEAKATTEEKADLAAAISAAEAKTLGFEDGEYAPYNNVDALTKLAAAKAIDPDEASGASVVAATTALNGAAWTANDGEQNAIYNGKFALSENDGAMAGWVTDHSAGLGGAYHARAFVLTSEMGNYDNLAAFGQGDATRSCAYFRFDGTNSARTTKYTYGTTDGYTMPLKTNTIYKLTAQAGGWGQVDKNFQIAVVSSTDANVVAQNLKTPATGVHAGGSVIDYEMYFVVPSAGNYKLVLNNPNDVDNAVVVSNIELFSTDALEFADGSVPTYAPGTYPSVKITRTLTANRWATAVYPFAVSGVDNIAVLDSYDNESGDLGFTSAAASTANVPFLMMSTTDKSEITLSNVEVAAANATPANASEAYLIGAYSTTPITNAEKNYVLSNNAIYSVGESGATINPYRAYIQIAVNSLAKALRFVVDGQATNVTAPEVAETEEEEILFNMAGIQVDKNFKGFVVNQKGEKRFNR